MQKCLKCSKDIRYIATSKDRIVVCDNEQIEVITENGHVVKGYRIHNCKLEAEDEKK